MCGMQYVGYDNEFDYVHARVFKLERAINRHAVWSRQRDVGGSIKPGCEILREVKVKFEKE